MDRNYKQAAAVNIRAVATREGGVDRNPVELYGTNRGVVATREGGVDRNRYLDLQTDYSAMSPPARVAWIETGCICKMLAMPVSPPARVAWIETKI